MTQGQHRYQFHCPIRHPLRGITKTLFHTTYKSSDYEKNDCISDAPLNFALVGLNFSPRT